jgi:hypothetical protein
VTAPVRVETALRDFAGHHCDDGYAFMAAGEEEGWQPVADWGIDGWDLGSWPYVVVLFRGVAPFKAALEWQRAIYVEGDITIETFDSAAAREHATDETALFYWQAHQEPWLDRPAADLRGPYRRRSS